MRRRFARWPRNRVAGFSLIEVSLAIGIVGFAFVSMFGLLPTGLRTFHKAMDTSVSAQIAQRVIGSIQQTEAALIVNNAAGSSRYFDETGTEVDLTKNPKASWIYKTFVSIDNVNSGTGGVGGLAGASMRSIVVKVVNDPGNITKAQAELNEVPGISLQTYSTIIAINP